MLAMERIRDQAGDRHRRAVQGGKLVEPEGFVAKPMQTNDQRQQDQRGRREAARPSVRPGNAGPWHIEAKLRYVRQLFSLATCSKEANVG